MNVEPPQKGFKTFIILILLGTSAFSISRMVSVKVQSILLKAQETQIPENIKVTNITADSATITWLTKMDTSEYILFGTTEDLEYTQTTNTKSTTHYITLTNLSPNNPYYYKLGVGDKVYDNNGAAYKFMTSPRLGEGISHKAYGQVTNLQGAPAEAAIVYVVIKDNDNKGSKGISAPLSALTNANGVFTLDLATAKTIDLSSPFYFSLDGDLIEVDVRGQYGEKATVLLDSNQLQPTPTISLSVKGRLQDLTSQGQSQGEDIVLPEPEITKPQETNPIKRFFINLLNRISY